MVKRIIAAVLAASALAAGVSALAGCAQETYVEYTLYSSDGEEIRTDRFAENEEVAGEWENSDDPDGTVDPEPAPEGAYYMATGYSGNIVNLVIPSEINGIEVRGIGEQAFTRCRMTTLEIEEGVTEVGQAAFIYCGTLESAVLPSTLNVGESMFGMCIYLKSVTLPEGITSIGNQAFYSCYALAEIKTGEESDSSSSVNLPSTLTSIGGHAFYDCNALSGEVTVPEGVTEIKQYAFSLCSSVTSFVIEGDVTEIGFGAFGGCHALTDITIPDSVERIGDYAFSNTYELESITLSASLSYLGQYAFHESGVTEVVMPAGKGCYLYNRELEEDEEVGSDDVKGILYNFYYDESLENDENAKGRIPSTALADSAQIAEWLKGDIISAYCYFVSV